MNAAFCKDVKKNFILIKQQQVQGPYRFICHAYYVIPTLTGHKFGRARVKKKVKKKKLTNKQTNSKTEKKNRRNISSLKEIMKKSHSR